MFVAEETKKINIKLATKKENIVKMNRMRELQEIENVIILTYFFPIQFILF